MLNMLKPPVDSDGIGEQEFRDALRHFASGVTIISTRDASGTAHGMTATAFSSLSLSPPLVLVAVARGARCLRQAVADHRFGVSILHEGQVQLSRHFGGRPAAGVKPGFAPLDDVPVLEGAMVALACTLDDVVRGGDHSILIGLVTASRRHGVSKPLIHYGGHYRSLSKDNI